MSLRVNQTQRAVAKTVPAQINRRDFLKLLGVTSLGAAGLTYICNEPDVDRERPIITPFEEQALQRYRKGCYLNEKEEGLAVAAEKKEKQQREVDDSQPSRNIETILAIAGGIALYKGCK